jgi:hypothetical protein
VLVVIEMAADVLKELLVDSLDVDAADSKLFGCNSRAG